MRIEVGVDVGGTFTDAVVAAGGELIRAKAYSTRDVTGGILDVLSRARQQLELDEPSFFGAIDKFVLGNTIVTNVIDELRFPRVGLLTTAGFKDTLRIARSARGPSRDAHANVPPPEIVGRERIAEIAERVDVDGTVLAAVDEPAARSAIQRLLDQGVDAIAVCFLWSFKNAANEQAVGALVRELAPELPLTLSSELAPVYREYERMVTTALDAACKPRVASHFEELDAALRERGLRSGLKLMQVDGGFLSAAEAGKTPIKMFNSGPVGGVEGARRLGAALRLDRIVTGDMGGTSFDAAIVTDGAYRVLPRAEMGQFPTALTAVDISSIGAGGGSIAWIDARGLLRVGPKSAGSVPGPACYGRGGEEPTVTDATVAMGLIDPGYFLGGTIALDRGKALEALRRVADPLGFGVDEAAGGVYRLTTVQMANAIRALTVNRGHDPREFTMVSFGGACGLFAAEIARECDVARVVVPAAASVFSAFGLLHADSIFTAVQTTPWSFAQNADELERAYAGLETRVQEWFAADAIAAGAREVVREADMKFAGQVFEVTTTLPQDAFTDALKDDVRARFIADYEKEFGAGTAWTEAEIVVTNTRVKGIGRFGSDADLPLRLTVDSGDGQRRREIVEPMTGLRREVDVHRGLAPGERRDGPCVVEEPDTNIYVPDGATVQRDAHANYVIDIPERA
ncbi:hydantoinase/oxoprolinase family protein [Conexibacter sp. JD483]|uniref:hydantoinase/oxoprolinase family protein n=1 Tax=unclassified Conexibacter TaxID=2627773 RepID=UPI002726C2F8|nr:MULTISPECIES: hydantoinase/oxoprolinase family protein [unclassified Conexibacter]MDO8187768.1 hydantoinase/oxoprolinase family protein [Conexibacter sp. CPCC 205706]MDO8201377.1 hydantoinase/oxoprolinase family protein [Conexibacter sp. CPCC 205762]MDR9372900.1 hydantoinase/oxoprolinase family protein [Conexibacter sp. JD483]